MAGIDRQHHAGNRRAAVARQLHDELGQDLTALKYELVHTTALLVEAGVPRHLIDRLQSLVGVVEVTTGAVRRIAQDLRPPALDLDLSDAIEFEAAAISRRTQGALPSGVSKTCNAG